MATTLRCPRCGSDYLHHGKVVVFDREEDQPLTIRTTVAGLSTRSELVGSGGSGNPSGRRDGLIIEFECEGCGSDALIQLMVAQHKGQTELSWAFEEEVEVNILSADIAP